MSYMNKHTNLIKNESHYISINLRIDGKTQQMVKILLFCVLLQALFFQSTIFQQ
jgi:hypothetical protein